RVVGAEAEEDADVGAAEAVDRLVGIADGAEIGAGGSEDPEERGLERIDVLVLVDRDPGEAPAVALGAVGLRLEQRQGLEEEIVEVDKTPLGPGRPVGGAPAGKVPVLPPAAANLSHLFQEPLGLRGSEAEEIAGDLRPLRRGGDAESWGEPRPLRLLLEDHES